MTSERKRRPRPWFGTVLSRGRWLYIQVKDPEGKWRVRATGLRAVQENWDKAEALLAEVRDGLLAVTPRVESIADVRRRLLPKMRSLSSHRGSPAIRLTLKRRRAAQGNTACEACGWTPPPPATWKVLNAHHVVPRRDGGTDDPGNLVVLCPNCHAVAHALRASGDRSDRTSMLLVLKSLHESGAHGASTGVAAS